MLRGAVQDSNSDHHRYYMVFARRGANTINQVEFHPFTGVNTKRLIQSTTTPIYTDPPCTRQDPTHQGKQEPPSMCSHEDNIRFEKKKR